MKTRTSLLAAVFTAALISAGSASAQTPARGDAFVMEMFGQRGWQVSCELSQTDGDTITTRDRGRGLLHNSRVAVGEVVGGTCSYSVPERGELRLTVNLAHTGFECPFTATGDEFCRANLAAGASGSFTVSRMPAQAVAQSLDQLASRTPETPDEAPGWPRPPDSCDPQARPFPPGQPCCARSRLCGDLT